MKRLTIEEVKEFIEGSEGNGCKLLSTEYKNQKTPLTIKCACGNTFTTNFNEFKQGNKRQCTECGIKIRSKKHENKITFNCEWCGKEKTVKKSLYEGREHHFCSKECYDKWQNPNKTDEERELKRWKPEYKKSRIKTFERDNYTCQCCGDNKGGNLNAHHIFGHDNYEDLRFEVGNILTLCEDCHKEFHMIYGYGNNTWQQFREFLYNKYLQTKDLHLLALIETIDLRFIQLNNKAS